MIEKYKFGEIVINGQKYSHDVEVRVFLDSDLQNRKYEVLDWWRKEGHVVDIEDINSCLEFDPQIIVIGTGAYGMAKVTQNLKEFLAKRKINLIVDTTGEAVKTFNILTEKEENKGKTIVGFFHLTC